MYSDKKERMYLQNFTNCKGVLSTLFCHKIGTHVAIVRS